MDDAQLLVTILGAGGGGAALLELIKGIFRWLNAKGDREKLRESTAQKNAREAEEAREIADHKRRKAEEYVSILRRQLRDNGIDPIDQEKEP